MTLYEASKIGGREAYKELGSSWEYNFVVS
jgi:hypothetical protein